MGRLFFIAALVAVVPFSVFAKTSDKAAQCGRLIAKGPKSVELVAVWNGETPDVNFADVADVNGLLVWEVAEYYKSKKRLPIEAELTSRLKRQLNAYPDGKGVEGNLLEEAIADLPKYLKKKGAPKTLLDVLALAVKEMPAHFAIVQDKAQETFLKFFKERLRVPTVEELALTMKIEDRDALSVVLGNRKEFLAAAMERHSVNLLDARKRLFNAFLRAAAQRDVPDHLKVQANTPELVEVFQALVRTEGNRFLQDDFLHKRFTEEHFLALFAAQKTKIGPEEFPTPVLFENGIAQLEEETRAFKPTAFKNFLSDITFDMARAERAKVAIETKKGFLVSSVTAGIPIDETQWALMLKYAEDLDYDIVLLPTNQVLQGLDERLLDTPRVHVLTNTIENEFFRLWQIPIMAKNENPFASLDKGGQFRAGQLVIVGHPQIAHMVVPTGTNHIRPTQLWSAGSITRALYTYKLPVQGRQSTLAKNRHKNAFLVVQKADAEAGAMNDGAQNVWHVRPVYYDDSRTGGTAGFNDLGVRYEMAHSVDGPHLHSFKYDPEYLVIPDLHDWKADQRMLAELGRVLHRFKGIRRLGIHDPIDLDSISHWNGDKIGYLIRQVRTGQASYFREMMGHVQTLNALLALRDDLEIEEIDSNHSRWGVRLLDDGVDKLRNVLNGEFLAELRNARDNFGIGEPLEWVLRYREKYIDALPFADARERMRAESVFVSHPDRLRVLPFGRGRVVGPRHRETHINFHGDQGRNGAKGSPAAHQAGSDSGITGDSHQPAIRGNWFSVGTTLNEKGGYQDGGYSSWGRAFAVIYPDGTKQLYSYLPLAGTFEQRAGRAVLPPDQFFGSAPLEVLPTDNQVLPRSEVMDQHSAWVRILRGEDE